jgi:hypothetical protein
MRVDLFCFLDEAEFFWTTIALAPFGRAPARLACPLGSSTAAGSSVFKARPHALNRFALARKRGLIFRRQGYRSNPSPFGCTYGRF